jgi:hypothetical protein
VDTLSVLVLVCLDRTEVTKFEMSGRTDIGIYDENYVLASDLVTSSGCSPGSISGSISGLTAASEPITKNSTQKSGDHADGIFLAYCFNPDERPDIEVMSTLTRALMRTQ